MSAPLRLVLVGCGSISGAWLQVLAQRRDVSLVGLVDLEVETARQCQAKYRLADARIGTEVGPMLRATDPDIVFDCTVPSARASVVLAALRHGCHVLSEKPMASSRAEASRLRQAAARAGKLFAVMQNRRYLPHIHALRRFLRQGTVGEVTTLHSDFFVGAHFGGFRDRMKHPLLFDMAIHTFDQARFLTGADAVAVSCHEWNPRGSWYAHGASAVAVFEMSGGLTYTYRGSWCAEGMGTSWEGSWRAIGTRGSVTWDGGAGLRAQRVLPGRGLVRTMRDVAVPVSKMARSEGHAGCIEEFLACVRNKKIPETVCTDNIRSLAMVLGAIQSAETRKRVILDAARKNEL